MRFIILFVGLLVGWGVVSGNASAAWFGAEKPLLVIDDRAYSADDYAHWWEQWRDNENQQPAGAMPFVEWSLLVREAERMDLETLPEFQHKIQVFLKARALMALKQEEIDAKVVISEEELKRTYEQSYVPRRLLGVLEFTESPRAQAFYAQYGEQPLTGERLQKLAEEKPSPFILQQPQWLRPHNTPGQWLPLLTQATAGSLVGPLPLAEKTAILYVAEVKGADPDDYAKKREAVHNELRKQQEALLTDRLVKALIQKHQVRIDDEVLKGIDLADPAKNDLEQVVIDSDRSRVTVGYFLEQCRKEAEVTHRSRGDGEAQLRQKRQLAKAMVANSLVSWEALDRHYEERPPLQWAYQFYRQHRLVAELENRALADLQISEAEAKAYYQEQQHEFLHPERLRVVVVNGEEKAVRKVWTEAISGLDLVQAAKQSGVQVVLEPAHAVPVQHLSEASRQAVASLKPGELSQPFKDNGQSALVRLEEREPGGVVPYAQVEKVVKEKLMQAKRAKRKAELVATLKARSRITVDDEVWAALAKQYRRDN